MTMQSSVGLAQIFDFAPSVEPAAPVQILIASALGNLLEFLLNELLGVLTSEVVGKEPSAMARDAAELS